MKAWRMYGFGDIRLDEVQMPEIKPGWVLVKVRMLQLSITEVQLFLGMPVRGRERIEKLLQEGPRQMFGHEFCGRVVEVGEGVSHVKVGDRAFFFRVPACHECALCLAGHEELCRKGPSLAGGGIPGCLAEYVLLPAESTASIPDTITDSEATAMQPFAGATGDVQAARIEMGDSVVVLGQGVMGLNFMQLSRVCGAGKTIVVDVRDEALALSSQLGADIIINAKKRDPVEAVLEVTGGVGADIVFECAGGSPQQGLSGTKTSAQAVRMVRDQGKIVQIAMLEPDAKFEVASVSVRGIEYVGHAPCTWKLAGYALHLVASKRVQLAPLITHTLEGLDKVPEALEITANKARYGAINPAQVTVSR